MSTDFSNLLLIDIDGLRHDVFKTALNLERIPNIAKLLGGPTLEQGYETPIASTASSITFAAQASLFTGHHPNQHGIPGNQFFDRFGRYGDGTPRHYAFDVGDTLAVDDAVRVFTDGLAANCLQVPTLYETFAERGWRSVVAGNMYATGAETWLKPSIIDLARFTKGGSLFGLSAERFDRRMLDNTLDYLSQEPLPEILTVYMMGLDAESHGKGPGVQLDYLADVIDPKIGELWEAYSAKLGDQTPLVAIFSDHGQIEVIPDSRHSLRLSFPFEREMGHLFDALGLDVHDYPGEDPHCDAVVASNGGLGLVYLQHRTEHWYDPPRFKEDVLPVAHAFWEAHSIGKYAAEMEGSLAAILVRNAEQEGWDAPYLAYTQDDELLSLSDWFNSEAGKGPYLDPIDRIKHFVGPMSGDMLLVSNYNDGFYFGAPKTGIHGGLHAEDSRAMLAFGFPHSDSKAAHEMGKHLDSVIRTRCQAEGGRHPSTVDLSTGLTALL